MSDEVKSRMSDKVESSGQKAGGLARNFDAPASRVSGRLARFASRAVGFPSVGTADLEMEAERRQRTFLGISRYVLSFLLFVLLPAVGVSTYLAVFAADQYYAETRFAVRKAALAGSSDVKSALAALESGGFASAAGQDAYIITSYVHSSSIVAELSSRLDIRTIFTRPEADFWARLKPNASQENLTAYWNNMVTTYVDGPSGIVTVGVRAFRQQDALDVSRAIVAASEKLANDVSGRIRSDAVQRASGEVRRSEALLVAALGDLNKFRNSEGYIDPGSAAQSTSKLLLQLLAERIQLQNDLFVATRAMSETAPSLQAMKTRLTALERQITTLRMQLTSQSGETHAIASSLSQYEQLDLKRIFAEKLYSLAQEGLETAKRLAENQSIYVSVFVPPALPDLATLPKRLSLSIIFALTFLAIWGILALLAAAVEDHQF